MAENCPHAFRKRGDVSIHCKKLEEAGQKHTQCGHQYWCPNTKRYEASKFSKDCPLRQK